MIGTPEQPWINTDPFLDIERLKSLELDVVKGICRASNGIASYGKMFIDPKGRPDYFSAVEQIMALPDEHPHKIAFLEIQNGTSHDLYAQSRALKTFCKLLYGTYSGGPLVTLRQSRVYTHKNFAAHCWDTENAKLFPTLMQFIYSLPFTEIGRALIFITDHDLVSPLHVDHLVSPHRHEFLWFRTNLKKPFFIYDRPTGRKSLVTSHSAFFNEQTWHGSDPCDTACFSIRVDGFFTDEFRAQLGIKDMTDYNA